DASRRVCRVRVIYRCHYWSGTGIIFKNTGRATVEEMFLGSRSLRMVPLALSTLSSIMSSTVIIAFTAHFYAYGTHMGLTSLAVLLLIPVTTDVIIPALYRLKIMSIFEYLRARYNNKISITSCVMYFLVTVIVNPYNLFYTVFQFPFLLGCLAIGLNLLHGSCKQALKIFGGLRGVVLTDSMQAVIAILAPTTIIMKILSDSHSGILKLRPLNDFNFGTFVIDTTLDFTKDENTWSCLIGVLAVHLYRSGMDQMIVQRYLAARTLEDAKRYSKEFLCADKLPNFCVGILLIYWFRDCDPQLDQLLPFYVKKLLTKFPGFSGLFLSGVFSAAKSTISSIINSQAAVIYTDVVSQLFTLSDLQAARVTRVLVFGTGSVITVYSAVIPFLGSVTRIIMMIQSAVTGPFVGLFLMAIIFPCVNSK
ncbi:unnamed protein product, partial [Ixodes persulcatus]